MKKFKFILEYDGENYVGWQRQLNGISIQQKVEEALADLTKEAISTRGAGRTDAGVHALGQVFSFQTNANFSLAAWLHGTNARLPPSIRIHKVEEVSSEFDALKNARGKLYRYQIWNSKTFSPLHKKTHWHVSYRLNQAQMQAAANLLIGTHDFAAFQAADTVKKKSTVRTITSIGISTTAPEDLHIEVEGSGFLRHMVRILAGTLIDIGRGAMTLGQIEQLLVHPIRTLAGPTAPPHGLILCRVYY